MTWLLVVIAAELLLVLRYLYLLCRLLAAVGNTIARKR